MQHDKRLGAGLAMMLVAGNMIGSGIYLLPATLGTIGSVSILGWLAAIVGAGIIAGMFAWMTIIRPAGTNMISHIDDGLGPVFGFTAGFGYWVSCWVGNVAIALAVTGYMGALYPSLVTKSGIPVTTIVVLWLFVAMNVVGPRFVARFGGWTLLIGLLPVLLVAFAGWFWFDPDVFTRSWNPADLPLTRSIPQSVLVVMWAFLGLESAAAVASVVREPERNVPIATLGGVGIAALVYMSACTVMMGIVPAAELTSSSAPFADATGMMLGASIAGLVAICAALKAGGTLAGWILVTAEVSRTTFDLRAEASRNEARLPSAPSPRIFVLTGLLMTALVVASAKPTLGEQFATLINVAVVLTLFVYILSSVAFFRFAASLSARKRLAAWIIAAASGLFSLAAIIASDRQLLIWSAGTIVFAIAIYGILHLLVKRRI